MKRSKLIILIFMGLVLSTVGGYLLSSRQGGEEEIITKMEMEAETKSDLSLEEIHYVETKGGKKEWELRARSAQHSLKEDFTFLKDLTVTFFTEGGRIITLRGDEGSIKGKKEIDVKGNVVITSSDGYRAVTNSLRYDDGKRQICTSDPILIEKKGMWVKGIGLLVDLKEEKLYIQKKVETLIE